MLSRPQPACDLPLTKSLKSCLPELDEANVLASVEGLSLLETGTAGHTVSGRQNKSTQVSNDSEGDFF